MSSEIKTTGVKITIRVSESLRKKFKSHCKKLNVSVAQRVRDLVQKDLKS